MAIRVTAKLGDTLHSRHSGQHDRLRIGASGRTGYVTDREIHNQRLHDAEGGVVADREPGHLETVLTCVHDLLDLGPHIAGALRITEDSVHGFPNDNLRGRLDGCGQHGLAVMRHAHDWRGGYRRIAENDEHRTTCFQRHQDPGRPILYREDRGGFETPRLRPPELGLLASNAERAGGRQTAG